MLMIETISAQKTVETLRALGMRINVDTLHRGIRQGVYPFAVYIAGQDESDSPVYQIFKRQLDEWIDERVTEVDDSGV